MDFLPIRRALLSVTHKDGLAEFAAFLHANGVELVSTGGTLKFLENAGLPVTAVSDVTGFPEILGGRVKTLHPHIHGGILADKDNPEHLAVLKEKGIKAFDLICVNLYDFESALAKGLKPREAIEEIDIWGPCMLRAASRTSTASSYCPIPMPTRKPRRNSRPTICAFPCLSASAWPPVRSPRLRATTR